MLEGDVGTVGDIFAADSSFAATSANEVPEWYVDLQFASQSSYYMAANDSAVFDQCSSGIFSSVQISGESSTNPFASASCGSNKGSVAAPVALSSLVGNAAGLDGIACKNAFGEPSGPQPAFEVQTPERIALGAMVGCRCDCQART